MVVKRFINSIFTSNAFVLFFDDDEGAWVVDPGDSKPILQWMETSGKFLRGILVTHAHFDHIYGINDLCDVFPETDIYASFHAKEGLLSSKINRSYYTDFPFSVKSSRITVVEDHDIIKLSEGNSAGVLYTPGHNHDCLSYSIGQYLFTGDALIPKIKIHTKSKFGDKIQAMKTVRQIMERFDPETTICPGHGDICHLKDADIPGLHV